MAMPTLAASESQMWISEWPWPSGALDMGGADHSREPLGEARGASGGAGVAPAVVSWRSPFTEGGSDGQRDDRDRPRPGPSAPRHPRSPAHPSPPCPPPPPAD